MVMIRVNIWVTMWNISVEKSFKNLFTQESSTRLAFSIFSLFSLPVSLTPVSDTKAGIYRATRYWRVRKEKRQRAKKQCQGGEGKGNGVKGRRVVRKEGKLFFSFLNNERNWEFYRGRGVRVRVNLNSSPLRCSTVQYRRNTDLQKHFCLFYCVISPGWNFIIGS